MNDHARKFERRDRRERFFAPVIHLGCSLLLLALVFSPFIAGYWWAHQK